MPNEELYHCLKEFEREYRSYSWKMTYKFNFEDVVEKAAVWVAARTLIEYLEGENVNNAGREHNQFEEMSKR